MIKTYARPTADTAVNFVRNAAFTGALIWGFHGSWKRTLAVSATTLPLISWVGSLRKSHQGNFERQPPHIEDPAIHLFDIALFLGMRGALRTRGVLSWLLRVPVGFFTAFWFSSRLASLWPQENSHQDDLRVGSDRIYRLVDGT